MISSRHNTLKTDRTRFAEALGTRLLGRTVRWLDRIPSTNAEAKRWADDGAPHGAMVFADYQTGGRGRHGRTWKADPGLNLTLSLVLRPTFPIARFGLITLAASLAVRDAIDASCPGVAARIKWPNDILIEDKKCCGMLLESAIGTQPSDSFVILGVGVNVNQDHFPDELRDSATSLMLGSGRPIDRILFLADLLRRMEASLTRIESKPRSVVQDYQEALDGIGKTFRMVDAATGSSFEGVMRGVDVSGALRLETDSIERIVHAGDVQQVARIA